MATDQQIRVFTFPFGPESNPNAIYAYLVPGDAYSEIGFLQLDGTYSKVQARPLFRLLTAESTDAAKDAALDQINTAKRLGYEHVEVMTVEHDLLHMWLAQYVGMDYSPALWAIAHGHDTNTNDVREEEADVLAFTMWINLHQWPDDYSGYLRDPELADAEEMRNAALDFLVGTGLRVWQ